MEWIALGVSIVSLVISMLAAGLASGRADERLRRARVEPKPVCGCDHHLAFHDEDGCHFMNTDAYHKETHVCGCRKYLGPEPLPEFLP